MIYLLLCAILECCGSRQEEHLTHLGLEGNMLLEVRKEGYLPYFHHPLDSDQATRREDSPDHQQKIGLKVY